MLQRQSPKFDDVEMKMSGLFFHNDSKNYKRNMLLCVTAFACALLLSSCGESNNSGWEDYDYRYAPPALDGSNDSYYSAPQGYGGSNDGYYDNDDNYSAPKTCAPGSPELCR
jgi:hypothetical protein